MAEEDLIFGKNRHFFGGIEPSNLQSFHASFDTYGSNIYVKLSGTFPVDTVVDDQTLCTMAGVMIRRKGTDYPVDEFDGDLVRNMTYPYEKQYNPYDMDFNIVDLSTNPTGTYYYAAFPYTTQGVYNRSPKNRTCVNEPADMIMFSSESKYDSTLEKQVVELWAILPDNVTGATIRKGSGFYPSNENDGELVAIIDESGFYTDSDVTLGERYYYSAFTYTGTGAYNRNHIDKNRTTLEVGKHTYLYGYDLGLLNANAQTRVTYPDDVDNANFTPAHMDFDNEYFDHGDWPCHAGSKFMPIPCMLKSDGTVYEYLQQGNYKQNTSGEESEIENINFDGNAMMQWPKIYTKRYVENGIYKFRCCDVKKDNTWDCFTNYDSENNEIDYFYTSIYCATEHSGKLRSISDQRIRFDHTLSEQIAGAKANGDDWYIDVIADRLLIQDLLVLMAKTTNCQSAYGLSRVSSARGTCGPSTDSGDMDSKDLFYGYNANEGGPNAVLKVFGMEYWWGNIWRRTAGWMLVDGIQKIKLTRGTEDGSTAVDYNTTGEGYLTVENGGVVGASGGYIQTTKNESYGRLPIRTGGSSSNYETDGLYYNRNGNMYALTGGTYLSGVFAGPFCVSLGHSIDTCGGPDTSTSIGTGLSCKPNVINNIPQ